MKFTTLLPFLSFTLSHAIPLTPRDETSTTCGRRNTPEYCAGTNYTVSLLSTYLCGDSRLGPTRLPTLHDDLPVAPVLATALFGYDRFGGLCPGAFLARWLIPGEGWWQYPPQDGFVLADPQATTQTSGKRGVKRAAAAVDAGTPIDGNVTLAVNTLVDRFGSEYGNFVSPAGASYGQRALPPSSLATSDPAYPYNYHVYTVIKPLEVLAGPIAPWFGQAGAGVQYKLYQSVGTLITNGYLRREDASVLLP